MTDNIDFIYHEVKSTTIIITVDITIIWEFIYYKNLNLLSLVK